MRPSQPARALLTSLTLIVATLAAAGPARGATVEVAAAGDIARPNAPGTPQRQTARLITDVIDPYRVFMLGDAQYERGEYENFTKSYHPTWGAFLASTVPVPGNHEYETPRAAGYFRYFASVLPRFGPTARDPSLGYYKFNLGDWHVIGLNTNCTVPGIDCAAERAWVASDLDADGHLCEVAIAHHPNKSFTELLANKAVDLVLTGHRHVYERWDRAFGFPIRQLIVGTGGIGLGTVRTAADAEVRAFGVVELKLNATSYSWKFIDVSGNVRDSGSAPCRR